MYERMLPLILKQDVATNPVHIALFDAVGVVLDRMMSRTAPAVSLDAAPPGKRLKFQSNCPIRFLD